MPPGAGIVTLAAMLIALPFLLLRDLYQMLAGINRWRLHRASLPPALLNRSRAVAGAFALAFLIDLAGALPDLTGRDLTALALAALRPPHVMNPVLVVWSAAVGLALLFLVVGLTGARGAPRDPIAALIALAVGFGAAALWWNEAYLPAEFREVAGYVNPLLHALYIASFAAALLRAWFSAPVLSGNALRRIRRHIETRIGRLRPARPRSF
jgi:hypothetical protein